MHAFIQEQFQRQIKSFFFEQTTGGFSHLVLLKGDPLSQRVSNQIIKRTHKVN